MTATVLNSSVRPHRYRACRIAGRSSRSRHARNATGIEMFARDRGDIGYAELNNQTQAMIGALRTQVAKVGHG